MWEVEASEIFCMKLVKKVGDFLREVAQLSELAEPHLIGADHLLPPQRTPTEVVFPTSLQMMGDLTQLQGSGPDIAADTKAAALIRLGPAPLLHPA